MLVLLVVISSAQGANVKTDGVAQSFMKNLEFNRQLRVCNAYPMLAALDIFDKEEKLNTEGPLAYKRCAELPQQLKIGSKLDFRMEDATVGTFQIDSLPENDAILQLVISRHDESSTAVAFASHVFSKTKRPQVAVMDAYRGSLKSTMQIADWRPEEAGAASKGDIRKEILRYDSVVAIDQGHYELSLINAGDDKADADFVALPGECYIVIRVGTETEEGASYPQEVFVFPHSDAALLGAAASLQAPLLASLLATFAALLRH